MSVSNPFPQGSWIGLTPQINSTPGASGANYASVNDAYVTNPGTGSPFPNGAFNPVGQRYLWCDSVGRATEICYVRYNPTANVNLTSSNIPGVVYWTDETKTAVTGTPSESVIGALTGAEAGIMLYSSVTNGNYTFIQTGGFLAGCNVPSGTAKGDVLTGVGGSPTAFVLARIANGSAITAPPVALAWTAVSAGKSDINLVLPICA